MLALSGILFLLALANAYKSKLFPTHVSLPELAYMAKDSVQKQDADKESRPLGDQKPPSYFDPNTANLASLIQVGFSKKQAQSLINYRKSGATFQKAEDLKKLFIMSDWLYRKVSPWVRIYPVPQVKQSKATVSDELTKPQTKESIQTIDINTIDSIGLIQIRGIGAKTAHRVLRYRNWLGGFTDTSQFTEIWGLYADQKQILLKLAQFDLSRIKPIQINRATERELQSHPYIRFKAKILIAYRVQHGAFTNLQAIAASRALNDSLLQKLKPYLNFNP